MSNEISKLYFEVKRINHQLEQLRAQLKGTVETVGDLRAQVMHLRDKLQSTISETVPEGVSGKVQEPGP